jgi:signal transduction histidine kinase
MSVEQIREIFRIDRRNTKLGTENEPGTGLGVILCREMIEKHGGKINITSEQGIGSVFEFSLPAG